MPEKYILTKNVQNLIFFLPGILLGRLTAAIQGSSAPKRSGPSKIPGYATTPTPYEEFLDAGYGYGHRIYLCTCKL